VLAHLHVCSTVGRAGHSTYSPPPSLANASRRIFAPCEESDSRMVLLSRERRVECVVTARSPSGMSVQPDISIFVTTQLVPGAFLSTSYVFPPFQHFNPSQRLNRLYMLTMHHMFVDYSWSSQHQFGLSCKRTSHIFFRHLHLLTDGLR